MQFYSCDVMTIAVDDYINGGFNAYDSQITDHMPVGIRLVYAAVVRMLSIELQL